MRLSEPKAADKQESTLQVVPIPPAALPRLGRQQLDIGGGAEPRSLSWALCLEGGGLPSCPRAKGPRGVLAVGRDGTHAGSGRTLLWLAHPLLFFLEQGTGEGAARWGSGDTPCCCLWVPGLRTMVLDLSPLAAPFPSGWPTGQWDPRSEGLRGRVKGWVQRGVAEWLPRRGGKGVWRGPGMAPMWHFQEIHEGALQRTALGVHQSAGTWPPPREAATTAEVQMTRDHVQQMPSDRGHNPSHPDVPGEQGAQEERGGQATPALHGGPPEPPRAGRKVRLNLSWIHLGSLTNTVTGSPEIPPRHQQEAETGRDTQL